MVHIDYAVVYKQVAHLLRSRRGLAEPINMNEFDRYVKELTNVLCGVCYDKQISTTQLENYLHLVQTHTLRPINDDGDVHDVSELIDNKLKDDTLYEILERDLMCWRPGHAQIGMGEFFFCFYDQSSTFGLGNRAGYDVIIDGYQTEIKKHRTQFTTPQTLDGYADSKAIERLLVVKPVTGALNPLNRSKYACVTFSKMDWREAFVHSGKSNALLFK